LQEVGYEDVFNPDEINEIKDLYEKAHNDLIDLDKPQEKENAQPSKQQDTIVPADNKPAAAVEASVLDSRQSLALNDKYTLRSHFDMVRALHITADEKVLATVSEDCMIKLWSLPEMD
jgi:WD40 repeat protein